MTVPAPTHRVLRHANRQLHKDLAARDSELQQLRNQLATVHLERETLTRRCVELQEPVPMIIWCPMCQARHVDVGPFATRPHHTHSCQHCGMTWRPAVACTVGVQFLPGFKDSDNVK
jgi:transposase-like protein